MLWNDDLCLIWEFAFHDYTMCWSHLLSPGICFLQQGLIAGPSPWMSWRNKFPGFRCGVSSGVQGICLHGCFETFSYRISVKCLSGLVLKQQLVVGRAGAAPHKSQQSWAAACWPIATAVFLLLPQPGFAALEIAPVCDCEDWQWPQLWAGLLYCLWINVKTVSHPSAPNSKTKQNKFLCIQEENY